jgi:hypothetical protein
MSSCISTQNNFLTGYIKDRHETGYIKDRHEKVVLNVQSVLFVCNTGLFTLVLNI